MEVEIDIPGAAIAGVTDFGARQPRGKGPDLSMPIHSCNHGSTRRSSDGCWPSENWQQTPGGTGQPDAEATPR